MYHHDLFMVSCSIIKLCPKKINYSSTLIIIENLWPIWKPMSFFGAGSKPMSISGVKPKSMKRVEWVHHAGWRRWSPETPFSAFILSGAGSAALFTRWPSAASTKRRWPRATPLLFSFGMSLTAITFCRILVHCLMHCIFPGRTLTSFVPVRQRLLWMFHQSLGAL